jgi:hypothetical protein
MIHVEPTRRLVLALALSVLAASAEAQQAPAPPATYTPSVGQRGKDVVWVPTPQAVVEMMLDMAKVGPNDYVIDLGSGDGRTVITAAQRGAQALGVEYEPEMVELSRRNAEQAHVSNRATFVKQDLFETDLSKATVITMFLLPDINLKLRPKLLALKPGTRVVSNTFSMGDWKADQAERVEAGCDNNYCTVLVWIIPAQMAGRYDTPEGEFSLRQEYQLLSGTLRTQERTTAVEGRVIGTQVVLYAGTRQWRGRVDGKRLVLE